MTDLSGAANAAGITPSQAVANIVLSLASFVAACAASDSRTGDVADVETVEKSAAAVAESAGADAAYAPLIKSDDEQRYTLGVAFAPHRPTDIVHKGADGKRDIIRSRAIEDAAWNFIRKGAKIGLWHADGTEGHGQVVESYVYRGPDWTITASDGSTQVVKAGTWLCGATWDVPAWALIQSGALNGYSPDGRALRQPAHLATSSEESAA